MLKTCTTMSQKTTSPESGENSKLSGQGSDTLNLSSPSGEELKVAIQDPGSETNSIKLLLSEFKRLYEHRLRCLELDTTATDEEVLQKKVNFLWSYVNDLADQNQVLVQTIEDLQKEADYKVSSWGMKLCTSDRILDVSDVDLRTLLLDELVGPAAHVPHSTRSLVQITSELEDLQIQLQTKDMVISDLERELGENFQQKQKNATQALESSERLVYLQSELSCLQRIQKDSMKEIADKDICITKLQVNNELLQQDGADTRAELSKLNMRARELQEELKRREEEWRQREDKQRLKYEKELQKAEERRRQEQQEREEEWVKKVEEKEREEEWKRGIEEERKAHAQAVKKYAEKAAVLNSELAVSRKQVERQNRELLESHQKEETLLSEAKAKMVSLRGELSALFERRMEEKEAKINQLTEELNGVRQKMKEREEHVRHLDQDVAGLRATQESLKGTLAMKEKHTQQLVQDIAQLKESRASLQSKLQTSECMLSDISETQDQTKTSLDTERQQRQQIQDQLDYANKEIEHLQQEITHVRHTTEKKIQKRENNMCTLVKELTESKKQHSECQKELLQREKALEKLSEERDELRAKMEDRSRESLHLNQTKERLEADLALSHEKLHTSHLEVAALEGEVRHLKHKVRRQQEESCQLSEKVRDIERLIDQKEREQQQLHDQLHIGQQQVETFEGKLKRQEVEMELLHQQLKGATEELNDASLQAQQQKETVAIFRQKYTAAIEKVHRVQGQVELMEEELKYSQQQLRESQLATHSVKEELAEMEQRYKEKVGQWENSQEALDQLADELQANQNLLRESQQKADHLQCLLGSLQEQADTLKQQKLMLECDLRLFQQSHSHSDEEYISLLRHKQQLQKHCTEQVERLAECEKAILQMKSELERQAQEKVGLKHSLLASHHTHMSNRGQLEQEVIRLKKEVTRLELELADTQKVHVALLRQSEEELKEARREAARRSSEVDAQRGEVQRLQEELLREEEKIRSAIREKQSLSTRVRQLSQELEDLRCQLQVTVEELAARAGEARQLEGCLNEGKLAEGKIRSMAVRLETEVAELKRNLQQAVDHKVKAERDAQDAQDQVDTLRSELERTRSDNANLRHESQLVMTNVSHWITEQKASNESLTAQMKAQNKVLLIVTEEKEHLQDGYDTLKEEVKSLKEVAAKKERDMEHFKAQIRDQGIQQDERAMEKQGCVALNLSKIEDMQTRLRSNLEAIGMLNQQLNWLSRENKRLRRQLEEERSMRRQVKRLIPPPPPPTSSIHLSVRARPPPLSTSLPSSLPLPHPLSLDTATGDTDRTLTQTKLSRAVLERPGECEVLGEAYWIRPTASLEDVQSGWTSRDLN
ncbi:nuclear mitotic apparatus protein 1-like isoform X2 [Sander lucioperca]|uniref:nuclear mitotic apparatus protein 1-like isoform X2 n=1 Tax=Sander lucioperca TaxID=283035 RepID=UPI001653B7A1|nr:nuclear mitotic apparatus protein 1-like isoform X2 [Sander lucioperca]